MFTKTFSIQFGYFESLTQTIHFNSKYAPFEDVCNDFMVEFQNLCVQQISEFVGIPDDNISVFQEDNKPYCVDAFESGGEYFITFTMESEQQLSDFIQKYYSDSLYNLLSVVYKNYYDIDIPEYMGVTDITFELEGNYMIDVTFGTFKDIKEEKDGNNMGPSTIYC